MYESVALTNEKAREFFAGCGVVSAEVILTPQIIGSNRAPSLEKKNAPISL
jgi:hypothetical protein